MTLLDLDVLSILEFKLVSALRDDSHWSSQCENDGDGVSY